MSIASLLPAIRQLTPDEQVDLAILIWEGVANPNASPELSEDHKKLLDERIASLNKGQSKLIPEAEVLRGLRALQ